MSELLPELKNSTPNLEEFDPTIIPYQYEAIKYVRDFDYSLGTLEMMLSGSFGSAKSILMAHIGITHLMANPKAKLCLCRKALPDLKETIYAKFKDHMDGVLIEGEHYNAIDTQGKIEFWNGSEIISRSWHDKNYRKFRSLELSAAIIEELTENSSKEFRAMYQELFPRVGRLPRIKENFTLAATNPGGPDHAAYNHYIMSKLPTRKVFYSNTEDNPFLPKTYIEGIKESMTKQEVRRYIHGEWIEIKGDVIYYAYDRERSAIIKDYKIDERYPLCWTFDFNIGEGKPMSSLWYQHIGGKFYFFDEIIVEGARTLDICEEANNRGLLDTRCVIKIQGDATGRARSTNSKHSDYEVITKYLSGLQNKYGEVRFEIDVPRSNGSIRTRHSVVNAQLKNSYGVVSIFLDPEKCKMLDKGLRLTKLKKGGSYIEDDSAGNPWQHCTTALGYAVQKTLESAGRTPFRRSKVN